MAKKQLFYKVIQKDRKTGKLRCVILKHGDKVRAKIGNSDETDEDRCSIEVEGRVCINEDSYKDSSEGSIWICQDERDGCENANDKFGHKYSWVCHIKGEKIQSHDTQWIEPLYKDPDIEATQEKTAVIEDYILDDPMPENWEPSEQDKAFFS